MALFIETVTPGHDDDTGPRQVLVEVRENRHGNDLVDPADDTARLFTALTGRKTFTARDLDTIRQLGYTIVMRQESPRLPDGYGHADII